CLSLWQLLNPIKCCALFLFREALLCQSHHEARRSVPLTPRLEWQDERRSFCFPPPVGAGIHSRERQGRAASASQRTFSLSTRRTFSLSSDNINLPSERVIGLKQRRPIGRITAVRIVKDPGIRPTACAIRKHTLTGT